MKKCNNYVSTHLVSYIYDKNDDVEEILKNKFQEANHDVFVERVVIDCDYLLNPSIENTLMVHVYFKKEE